MRKLMFRTWDKEKNIMFEQIEIYDFARVKEHFRKRGVFEKRFELMQFTGLKDKKGKDIYEGDILKTIICRSFGRNNVWYFLIYLVEVEQDYNYGYKFNWKRLKENKIPTKTKEEYNKFKEYFKKFGQGEIIIGNIYENPYLLAEQDVLKENKNG